jgi:hypothetical protein
MSDQLQINVGADTKGLETGLQRAAAELSKFDTEVQDTVKNLKPFGYTIEGIATAAQGLGPVALKPATDGLKGLGDKAGETTDKLKKLPSQSNQATFALANLGRVASDAPFGFIAIANNIEPLVQSLQSLGKTSGGIGGTLKALGASLIGPGGLLLGFSLVSSAITVAVQKYGSLGNAINAIFGRQDALVKQTADAAKSYEKFNQQLKESSDIQASASGSAQGEISRVNALAAIVQDQTKSYNERNQALKDLQSISKTYFGNIDIEKGKLGELTTAVANYTQATIQSAITKGFESEIGAVNVELNKQVNLLAKLKERLDDARRAPQRIVGAAATVDTRDIIAAEQAFNAQAKVVKDLESRTKELNTAIGESINRYNSIVAPVTAANDATAKQAATDKVATKEISAKTAAITKENAARAQNLKLLLEQAGKLQTVETDKTFPALSKGILDSLQTPLKTFEDALKTSNGRIGRDFTIIPAESVQAAIDQATKIKDEFNKTVDSITNAFNATLGPAIDSVFSAIESGENVIQSIGQAFKRLISDLIKTTIKAAALAAIISAVTGTPFAANFKLVSGFGGAGGAGGLNIGRAAAPSFGGVSGFGGGLQLAGQVVFTQRGSDLVGVLNTQNARINRVG